jgi:hypothetical protein
MQMDGSRLPDRVTAQVGNVFPGPGPGCSLEHERADGPVFALGRMMAWCAERRMRERAVGCFRIRAEFQL